MHDSDAERVRPWREIARHLANERDLTKKRALMKELSNSFDPQFAICPICDKPCELTSCKIDEDGRAIHECCYLLKLSQKPTSGNEYS